MFVNKLNTNLDVSFAGGLVQRRLARVLGLVHDVCGLGVCPALVPGLVHSGSCPVCQEHCYDTRMTCETKLGT